MSTDRAETAIKDTFIVLATRRVERHGRGEYHAVLRWCETHLEPVWVYDDGSYGCPHDVEVETRSDDHDLRDGPWETARPNGRSSDA